MISQAGFTAIDDPSARLRAEPAVTQGDQEIDVQVGVGLERLAGHGGSREARHHAG